MVSVDGLAQRIRAISEALARIEHDIRDTGELARGFLAHGSQPNLAADWRNVIDAAADVALLADEILNPPD